MKWGRLLFLLAACAAAVQADELRLRDGTVILGSYVGGTQKEVYFQHTPAGSDMYPLFMVESLKFNSAPTLTPSAASHGPIGNPVAARRPAGSAEVWAARIRWMFALLLPPALAAQFAHPAY
jgi:hypothetical protein